MANNQEEPLALYKYIGDAIVAVFASLIGLEIPAHYAVRAAVRMIQQLHALNKR
jgi:class 3 adenylate cyclase